MGHNIDWSSLKWQSWDDMNWFERVHYHLLAYYRVSERNELLTSAMDKVHIDLNGFNAKMDLAIKMVEADTLNLKMAKYEVVVGYAIKHKIRFGKWSFELNDDLIGRQVLKRCVFNAINKHFTGLNGTYVFKSCEDVLRQHTHGLLPKIQARVTAAPLQRDPTLSVKINNKRTAAVVARQEHAVERLTNFMSDYKDYAFTEADALTACRLAMVKKIHEE